MHTLKPRPWMLLVLLIGLYPMITRAWTVELALDPNTEADLNEYKIYMLPGDTCPATSGLPGSAVGTIANSTSPTGTMTVPDTANGACFDATATDLAGNESAHSNKVFASRPVAPPPPPVLPPAPTNVRWNETARQIEWDAVPNVSGYQLYVHQSTNAYNCPADFVVCHEPGAPDVVATHYPVTLLSFTEYDAWIHSVALDGTVNPDPQGLQFTTGDLTPPNPPPAAPTGLRVVSTRIAADGTVTGITVAAARLDCPDGVSTSTTGTTSQEFVREVRCKPVVR